MSSLLSPEKSDIRMGDLIELRSGERLIVDSVSDWYGDRDGRHDGPWVRTKTWERHLLSEVVKIVERNPRLCVFCGEGVTSTNPETKFCRTCFYTGRSQEEHHAEILEQFHIGLPDARYIGIEHTGGGCFWLGVYGPEGSPYYWAATDGEASIPDFAEGEGWGVVCRYHSDDNTAPTVTVDGYEMNEYEGVPILEGKLNEDGWFTPEMSHQEVIAAIAADMERVAKVEFPMRAYSSIVVAPEGVTLIDREINVTDEPMRVAPDVMVWHGDAEGVSCGVIATHREAAYKAIERVWPEGVIDDFDFSADEPAVLALIQSS